MGGSNYHAMRGLARLDGWHIDLQFVSLPRLTLPPSHSTSHTMSFPHSPSLATTVFFVVLKTYRQEGCKQQQEQASQTAASSNFHVSFVSGLLELDSVFFRPRCFNYTLL